MYGGFRAQCSASSLLASAPPAIFLCAHIDVELVATEDRQVFLYSLCEMCVYCVCIVCACETDRMSFCRKDRNAQEKS